MTPIRVTLALMLVMVAVLLAAGCAGQQPKPIESIPASPPTSISTLASSAISITVTTVSPTITTMKEQYSTLSPTRTQYDGQNSGLLLEIVGSTTVVVEGATSVADLKAKGVSNPEELILPAGIKKYDLVKFDIPVIKEKVRTGQGLPFLIRGKEYLAKIPRMTFENIDDGIDSYSGKLLSEKNSDVLITVGPNAILGSAMLNGETFWISPVGRSSGVDNRSALLHYIYSSKDINPVPSGWEAKLCGGRFEVYNFGENWTPNGTGVVLSDNDFNDFHELDAVIRGEKRTKATCSNFTNLFDSLTYCIGGGRFSCEEGVRVIGNYADFTYLPNVSISGGGISGSGISKYLVYDGKYYYMRVTQIS